MVGGAGCRSGAWLGAARDRFQPVGLHLLLQNLCLGELQLGSSEDRIYGRAIESYKAYKGMFIYGVLHQAYKASVRSPFGSCPPVTALDFGTAKGA